MTKNIRILSLFLTLVMMVTSLSVPATASAAAKKKASPSTIYTAVKKSYGKSFPLGKGAKVATCDSVGVSKKLCSSYYGQYKGTKTKYIIFVAKAKKSSDVKKIKSQLNSFIKTESRSMNNYLTAKGKKLYKNAKVGSQGNFVYLVMLDTSSNKKAVNAIKKAAK